MAASQAGVSYRQLECHVVEEYEQVAHIGLSLCHIMEQERSLLIVVVHEVNEFLQERLVQAEVHIHVAATSELQLLGLDKPPKIGEEHEGPLCGGQKLISYLLLNVREHKLAVLIQPLEGLKSIELLSEKL